MSRDTTRTNDTDALLCQLANARHEFLAFAHRRLPSGDDAEDVVQRALERAATKIHQVDDPDRLFGWFHTILRHAVADELTRRGRRAEHLTRLTTLAEAEQDITPSPQHTSPEDLCSCGVEMVDALPESWRVAMLRVDVVEDSVAEVARDLGISANNVRVRAHRARARLREQFEEQCGATSAQDCLDCEC